MVTDRETLLDEMLGLVPEHLHNLSGSILYSGYETLLRPSPIYLMAINPGGDPTQITTSIADHTRNMVLNQPGNYSAYINESWKGRPLGEEHVQRRTRRLLNGLGLDPRNVPATNLVFQRTPGAGDIPPERFAECWPFHRAMIEKVGARVIVCLGAPVAEHAKKVSGATWLVEDNHQPERTWIYRMHDGRAIVRGVHPVRSSDAAWQRNVSLISRALAATAT